MSSERVSATILQKVQVLSVGRRTIVSDGESDIVSDSVEHTRRRIVTLMVSTEQAKSLQLAVNHGTISLALRNPLDEAAQSPQGTYLSELSKELADHIAALVKSEESMEPMSPTRLAAEPKADAAPTTTETAAAAPAPAEVQYWITTIYHGRLKDTEKFPLSEANASHGTSPEHTAATEDGGAVPSNGRSGK
jgi:Flp pilus assembly protein CpaB